MTLMTNARRRVPLALATLVASGTLAACGSSSASSSSSTSTSTSSSASASGKNRSALIACLQQHGVTPPPGAGNGGKPPAGGNGGTPPAGANGGGAAAAGSGNSARQAAFKACGATGLHARGTSSQSSQN
jgi:hypothetical protein